MKLYRHLAWDGIRKNSRLYVPYLLTGVGAVSFFYILVALSRLPEGTLPGRGSVQVILNLGSFVLWMFSLLLLFYTHSFLIRRRNREFALYNVLGMGKRDIARILCWETLLSGGISLAGGLALGILLGKLAELGLLRMVGAATDMVYRVSAGGLLLTLGLYAGIFLLILISSLVRVGRSTAVQLMRSQAEGEKPPRANWALAVLGILLLAGAYYLAVTIREPLAALTWFFIAVLMVIAATYLLFISGSVALCRLLQKNPRFYYQKRHFVSVSSLVYRMKRNGAGLASICILGTMVLVMLSSTTCLYFGAEDSLHTRYPRDENITAYFPDRASQSGDLTPLRTAVADAVRRSGMSAANVWEYRSVSSVMTIRDGVLSPNEGFGDPVDVTLIPLADYNAAMGTDLTLPQGQVYVCRSRTGYQGTSLTLQNGPTWQVAGLLDNFSPSGSDSASVVTQLWLIVPDLSAADALEQVMNGQECRHFADINGPVEELPRVLSTPRQYAYLRIAEGCSNRCAYCVIPSLRGNYRSRRMEDILREAQALADDGVQECIVIAQDITRYGMDLYGERRLPQLLRELCKLPFHWVRLHYLYPDNLSDELIDTIAGEEKICNYLDIPIQHCNDAVLKAMRRRETKAGLEALFARLRERIPGVVLRTSLITGLPYEDEAAFEELCSFLGEQKLQRVGAFAYSPEEGTPAAKMLNRVDTEEAQRRAELVMEVQSQVMDQFNDSRMGDTVEVLCDGWDGQSMSYVGRSYAESPGIDGNIYFTSDQPVEAGDFVRVRITGAMDGELTGERTEE